MALTLRSMRGVFDARIGLELHIVEFANLAFDLGVSATAFCALMVWPPGRDLGTRAPCTTVLGYDRVNFDQCIEYLLRRLSLALYPSGDGRLEECAGR